MLWAVAWNVTVGGTTLALCSAGFVVVGAVGSTSMFVFFNFAAQYGPEAISATSVGIGACAQVTNVLGIAQGFPA